MSATPYTLTAESISLRLLFTNPLLIPPYQRPYCWTVEQVQQLLNDIKEGYDNQQGMKSLLGTVIIHQTEEGWEIVDGQQRITTLALLAHVLEGAVKVATGLQYNHVASKENLLTNYTFINEWVERKKVKKEEFATFVQDKLHFVLIRTRNPDDAFVFFDTQNTRGKKLEVHDLLKAHHLRYIDGEKEGLDKSCAQAWERMDKGGGLKYVVDSLLAKTRARAKQQYGDVDVLREFKAQRVTAGGAALYRVNRYNQPPLFRHWAYSKEGGMEVTLEKVDFSIVFEGCAKMVVKSKQWMPFQVLQSLEGGEQFFWFVEKYHELYEELFCGRQNLLPAPTQALYDVLRGMDYNTGMEYILEVYEGCLLFYYDKFGTDGMNDAAMWLEHTLFHLRLRQGSIQRASMVKYLRDTINPYVVINEAAFPEHVVRELEIFAEKLLTPPSATEGIRKEYRRRLYGTDGFYTTNSPLAPPALINFQTFLSLQN